MTASGIRGSPNSAGPVLDRLALLDRGAEVTLHLGDPAEAAFGDVLHARSLGAGAEDADQVGRATPAEPLGRVRVDAPALNDRPTFPVETVKGFVGRHEATSGDGGSLPQVAVPVEVVHFIGAAQVLQGTQRDRGAGQLAFSIATSRGPSDRRAHRSGPYSTTWVRL
jgi:hypothetical protein